MERANEPLIYQDRGEARKRLDRHAGQEYHKEAPSNLVEFLASGQRRVVRGSHYQASVLISVAKIVELFGRQALAFRGGKCRLTKNVLPISTGHELYESDDWHFGNFAALYLLRFDAGDEAFLNNLQYGIQQATL